MRVPLLLGLCGCALVSIDAQTQRCARYRFPPDVLTPNIYGECGRTGLFEDNLGKPEFLKGRVDQDDIMDGSPPIDERPAGCNGIHEKMQGRGGADIFKIDISIVTTAEDWQPGENDLRAYYPQIADMTDDDLVVIYDSTDDETGENIVDKNFFAEIYNVPEDALEVDKSKGTIYIMIGRINHTKVAKIAFQCPEGKKIWYRPCHAKSGWCTSQYCDRPNKRVLFPLQCIPEDFGPYRGDVPGERPRKGWYAKFDGFFNSACSCNNENCSGDIDRRDAGCCGNSPLCDNFPDSYEDSWSGQW